MRMTFFGFFLTWVSLYSQDWAETHYVAQVGLKLLILLPQPPECWDHRHVQQCPATTWPFLSRKPSSHGSGNQHRESPAAEYIYSDAYCVSLIFVMVIPEAGYFVKKKVYFGSWF
jgi:hypothetical protein